MDFKSQRPDLDSLCEAFVANNAKYAMQPTKLVDGIVVTRVGKTGLQFSMPIVQCKCII